jgi:hypothetical protein
MIGRIAAVMLVAVAVLALVSVAIVAGPPGRLSGAARLEEVKEAPIAAPPEPVWCQGKPADRPNPRYEQGEFKYVAPEGGYAFWLPTGWTQYALPAGQQGVMFRPCPRDERTYFAARRRTLSRRVEEGDVPALRENFERRLAALAGVEVESQGESLGTFLTFFEARYTYLDGEALRKSWLRVVYLGEEELSFVAHGSTPDEFEYWLPMLFSTMMTIEL